MNNFKDELAKKLEEIQSTTVATQKQEVEEVQVERVAPKKQKKQQEQPIEEVKKDSI